MKGGRYIVPIILILAVVIFVTGLFFSHYTFVVAEVDLPIVTGLVTSEVGAQKGDLVEINFILTMTEDDTIVDTNNKEIAEKWGILNYVSGPFRFFLGKSGKVKGFDDSIIGMEQGDKETFIIEPSVEPKEETIKMTEYVKRKIEIPKFTILTKDQFTKTFHKPPVLNLRVTRKDSPWSYKVVNMSDTKVAIEMLVKEGDDVKIPGYEWKSKALMVKPYSIVFMQNPVEGQEVETDYGTAVIGIAISNVIYNHKPELDKEFSKSIDIGRVFAPTERFFVKEINEDSFVIRKANCLEQERLSLEVEILKIN